MTSGHRGLRTGRDGDGLPGTPWTPPSAPPQPDSGSPPGEGEHRKPDGEDDGT
ncbi:hypothetical protein [Streptomyces sodiiphilus]